MGKGMPKMGKMIKSPANGGGKPSMRPSKGKPVKKY